MSGPEPAWEGDWIVAAEPGTGAFERVLFRRTVALAAVPERLVVRIAADSRYVLWVNGVEMGRGPARAQPYRLSHDARDIATALRTGDNVVVVLVTRYGAANAHWQPAAVDRGLGTSATMILDAPGSPVTLASGPAWESLSTSAWTDLPPRGKLASLPIEVRDERLLPAGWTTGAPDAAGWRACAVARSGHSGAAQRARPPAYPFGPLPELPLAAPTGATVSVPCIGLATVSGAALADPVDDVFSVLGTVATWTAPPDAERVVAEPAAGHRTVAVFDAGRIVSGIVTFRFDGPAGARFRLAYLERPFHAGDETRYLPRAGAELTLGAEPGEYRSLELNGLRLIAVVMDVPEGAPAHLAKLRVEERLYPFAGDAGFDSSDAGLVRLWHAGVRTVQVNSLDALTDCPTREQRAWVGDGVVHLGVHLVANADWRLAARHLTLADSPRADGILPMSAVGDLEAAGGATIPDWSLHWIHALREYAAVTKDRAFVAERLPTALRVVRWFVPFARDGVLADVPEWVMIDWSSVVTRGRSSALTALWTRALREVAELAQWLGDAGSAEWAHEQAARVEVAFDLFWDARRGLYVDHVTEVGPGLPASQAASAAAIVAGLVPHERLGGLVARITDEARLVDRGWNAASPTVELAQKIRDREAGIRRIDWDAENEIVRAEPFFSAVVHEAVARAGRADLLPAMLRRWERFLVDGYDTFGECWHWGSPAHGWSSTPTTDLVRHVVGVRPRDLASEVYVIDPARILNTSLSARVPTHRGMLDVRIEAGHVRVDAPVPLEVFTDRGPRALAPGAHTVALDGR